MQLLKKSVIFSLFMTMVLTSGCCRKDSEIILTEPTAVQEKTVSEAASTELKEDNSSEDEKGVETETAKPSSASTEKVEEEPAEDIMVHVCGAVLCEGVYELPGGSRVIDAVRAAGGFDSEADTSYVNQAQVLEDGVKLKIPTTTETEKLEDDTPKQNEIIQSDEAGITGMTESADSGSGSKDGKVNINTASETELCSISGIGPGRAKKILEYREQNGKFERIEDIMKVSGIKDKFFAKIKDYITV